MQQPTRRAVLAGGTTLLAAALAGCGQTSGANSRPSAPASPTPSTSDHPDQASRASGQDRANQPATPFPVKIANVFGTTTIGSAPRVVYSLGYTDHDPLMALGILPVAITRWFPAYAIGPWAKKARRALSGPDPAVVTDTDGIGFEKVAAADPDLISSYYSGLEKKDYQTLSAIAPTVTRPPKAVAWQATWDGQLHTLGKAVGKSELAERLADRVRKDFATTKAAHGQLVGKTLSLCLPNTDGGGVYVYTTLDGRYHAMQELGVKLPPGVAKLPGAGKQWNLSVAAEQYTKLDADLIGVIVQTDEQREALEKDKVWNQVPAVKDGRVVYIPVDPYGYALSFNTVLSLPFAIRHIAAMFSKVLSG